MVADLIAVPLGFDSTYEGLKRDCNVVGPVIIHGFDSTYEGLKLSSICLVTGLRISFDSTYEGLKPV
ncbi:MAG: hypothetical protein NZ761_01575, partial [Dehalococcoidia bacterium]|nr:hypothetical protein [Dehalococcoidia bacterium]